jgi:hypothetical protein
LTRLIRRTIIDDDRHDAHTTHRCRYAGEDLTKHARFVVRWHNDSNQAIVSPLG